MSLRTEIPIWDHRTVIGSAATAAQAARVVRSRLQTIPAGWTVSVRARDTSIVQLPAGWVYIVHPNHCEGQP